MGLRRKSRELAAQTLYALDFRELDPEFLEYGMLNSYPDVLNELAKLEKMRNSATVIDFADDLVKNAIINRTEIIQKNRETQRKLERGKYLPHGQKRAASSCI